MLNVMAASEFDEVIARRREGTLRWMDQGVPGADEFMATVTLLRRRSGFVSFAISSKQAHRGAT